MDRVRFIAHQGKQILFIDMTNCVSEEAMLIASEVQRVVTAQPRNSVFGVGSFPQSVRKSAMANSSFPTAEAPPSAPNPQTADQSAARRETQADLP